MKFITARDSITKLSKTPEQVTIITRVSEMFVMCIFLRMLPYAEYNTVFVTNFNQINLLVAITK